MVIEKSPLKWSYLLFLQFGKLEFHCTSVTWETTQFQSPYLYYYIQSPSDEVWIFQLFVWNIIRASDPQCHDLWAITNCKKSIMFYDSTYLKKQGTRRSTDFSERGVCLIRSRVGKRPAMRRNVLSQLPIR